MGQCSGMPLSGRRDSVRPSVAAEKSGRRAFKSRYCNDVLKREKFEAGERRKKRIWYLELPLIFCVMLGFVGLALALLGSLAGFIFLIISVICGVLLFALLNRREPI